jgi:hypothetical protein
LTVKAERAMWAPTAAALGCAAGVAWAPWIPVQAAAGLALVFLLPGLLASYAAVPPPAESARFRLVLAVALSIAVTILVGIVQMLAADEITRLGSAAIWSLACMVAGAAAIVRADRGVGYHYPGRRIFAYWRVLVFPAVGMLVVAVLSVSFLTDYREPQYTELAIVSDGARPVAVITNRADVSRTFRYSLRAGGTVVSRGSVRIGPERSRGITFAAVPPGSRVRANVQTLDGDDPRAASYVVTTPGEST